MHFALTQEQDDIKRTAHDLLAARFPLRAVQELADTGRLDDGAAREIAGLGWIGIAVPERHGGAGLGLIELVTLQEQVGYALAPAPRLGDIAAALVLAASSSDRLRDRWLPPLLAGEVHGSVGLRSGSGSPLMLDAADATFCIILDEGFARFYEADEVITEPVRTIDLTRRFTRVSVAGDGEVLECDVDRLNSIVGLALAADSVGIAQHMVETAAEYARDRKQFGAPIGVHQGVSHRCARMLLMTESARSLVQNAAWQADRASDDFVLAAEMARSYALGAAWRVAADAVQVHGGIGFTWELPVHLFLKRSRLNAELLGSPADSLRRVAAVVCVGA